MNAKQVLIIDDRVVVRQTLRSALIGLGCEFTDAEDGESALKHLEERRFDVVFLDLMLPDVNGIEVLRRVRKASVALGKVIVLTGLPEDATREEALRLGAFRYMSKDPIDRQAIRQAFVEAVSNTVVPIAKPAPPAVIELPTAQARESPTRAPRAVKKAGARRPRILVLDDSAYWLDTISRLLGDDFEIIRTSTAKEAYARVRKEAFELVLIDIKLPGDENGLDVLSRMRRSRPDLRAVILTEYPDYATAVESGKRGAIDYVSKGEPTTLTATVTRILNGSKPIRVFISYDRRDSSKVLHLYERLMTHGFVPWMDTKSLMHGQRYEPQIERAIEQCDHFVFCLSRYSLAKEGLIRKELNQALDRLKEKRADSSFLIPVRLEDCDLDPDLRKVQAIDLFRRDGFSNLLKTLTSNDRNG